MPDDFSYQPLDYSGWDPNGPPMVQGENGEWSPYDPSKPVTNPLFQNPPLDPSKYPHQDTTGMATVNQANALGQQEAGLLNRQAPALAQMSTAGLDAARGNQLAALMAQQRQMQGPSLAGMQANQAFGQARQQMGGAASSSPLAMRAAMLGGNQALGNMAQQGGAAVGNEYSQRLGAYGGAAGALGQGDVASQNAMQQLAAAQQKLYLQQRQQNLAAAQGYEQNYWNVMSAQQRKALADYQTKSQLDAAQRVQNQQTAGAGIGAAAAITAAAIGAAAAA